MLRFRLYGVRITVCFGFAAVWALFCLIRGELALPLLLASLIHELGHAAAMCACGQKLAGLKLWGGGILMTPRRSRMLTRRQEVCILLSGPAVNLAVGLGLWLAGARLWGVLHWALGLWNLLPYRDLDGGAVLRCLCTGDRIHTLLTWLVCGGTIVLAGACFAAGVRNVQLFSMLGYLFLLELPLAQMEKL
ncbi:hypothetical protein [Ruminococcus sp.]|uniref:hypothetical protein n=1 Tax=Ruminococcus sp. TaxID=41978 RepID=UPI0025E1F5ED|nr:hypothetical protein [Ruminococcus sp.]MCI5816617.1 hypothetical protein [Ruminococcus sp.]MDD7556782.1 hypothetical protein [Ruminococcus sp.]MDY4963071.1 hypothetical protein [Ruminococcus callidus]